MNRTAYATFVIAVMLQACAVGPDYEPPAANPGAEFAHATGRAFDDAEPEPAWWRSLRDERLSTLIDDALTNNRDLHAAVANVRSARAIARIDRFDRYPTVTASASSVRERTSASRRFSAERTETTDSVGLDAAWEIDVFGAVSGTVNASAAAYEAAVGDHRALAVLVAGEVARTYIELRGAQRQLQVARMNAENQESTYELTLLLDRHGRGSELDVVRARAQLDTTRASIDPLEAEVARAIHRLGVLTGRQPSALTGQLVDDTAIPEIPDAVAIGNPDSLIRRRADVHAAERRVAAATARIGIETANLFPRISLLGSVGYLATGSAAPGDSGTERASIGPFLSWAAFDLGRVRAAIDAADADAEASLANYEQAVLVALEETENALVGFARTASRKAQLQDAETASRRAVELAQARYRNGIDSFLTVLDAERRLLDTQTLLARAEIDHALAFVAVYKALGGSWQYRSG